MPSAKQAKTVKSASKVMMMVFFNYEGIVSQHAIEPGSTGYYADVLWIMVVVTTKRLLLKNGFLLYYDNARLRIATYVGNVLQNNNIKVLPHPLFSPDVTSCNFRHFL